MNLTARLKDAHERMRAAYWGQKDVGMTVAIADQAILSADGEADLEVLGVVKAIAYDLGSFTWPGWAEPGIGLTPEQVAIGLAAARLNLRLAKELRRDALPTARAHWLLGAHLLAASDRDAAATEFSTAERLADEAGETADALLYRGYRQMAGSSVGAGFEATLQALKGHDHGVEFASQLATAARVLMTERVDPGQ